MTLRDKPGQPKADDLVEDAVKPRRILLVDDNPDVRYLTRVTIESPTCAIVGEASNGAEALEVVEEVQPDVVVMDMKMPIMDGLEATKILKYRFPDLEVIIVSGSDDPVSNKELLDAGASASIDKDKLDDLVLRLDQGAAAS